MLSCAAVVAGSPRSTAGSEPSEKATAAAAVERDPVRARELYRAALAAREAKDLAGYCAKLEEARITFPDPANLWFRLAGARAVCGDPTRAFEALEAQVTAGMFRPDFETNADLLPLHEHMRWKPISAAHARIAEPVVASEELLRLPATGVLTEGIAFDPTSGSWFFSQVNRRAIVKRTADGTISTFATLAGRLPGSPLGLAIDTARKCLWVATAGLPHGEGLPAEEKDRGALAAFDLASGALVESAPIPGEGHGGNDLVVGGASTIYLSDPEAKAIWKRGAEGTLERLPVSAALVSPGGLALSADEKLLYVADWSAGLAVVDLASNELRWLSPPRGSTTLGIDGLVREGDTLLAIQNGVAPARITRFRLAPDGRSLVAAELLERAVPEWDEATLGIVHDGALVYVANSHWPRFDDDGKAQDPASLTPTSIRRLPLPPAR